MKVTLHFFSLFCILSLSANGVSAQSQSEPPLDDMVVIRSIYDEALRQQNGYQWLTELTAIGGRLAGSAEANKAVAMMAALADSLGFDIRFQKVKVPHWERGTSETAYYLRNGKRYVANATALGGSVPTPEEGLLARVVEINSFAELEAKGDQLKGNIAFFNIPMDPTFITTFFAYGQAVKQRWVGAVKASQYGAKGVVIRSLSSSINKYPHTGTMTYEGAENKIPALAISTWDAERLSDALAKNPDVQFYMKINSRWLDSTYSHNLIAEIPGTSKKDEIMLTGGHIDSWDIGDGAHDDGAGCIHALESVYLLHKLSYKTKRTLRVVLFMNEEFGLNGARTYAREAALNNEKHVVAIESDGGGFSPRGVSISAHDTLVARIKELRELLEPYGIYQFKQGGSGADVSQLRNKEKIILMGLRPDSHRYFEVHHSARDVIENVNARELEMGSATLAAMLYLIDKYDITAVKE
mgnify:CR=1 FL=1